MLLVSLPVQDITHMRCLLSVSLLKKYIFAWMNEYCAYSVFPKHHITSEASEPDLTWSRNYREEQRGQKAPGYPSQTLDIE